MYTTVSESVHTANTELNTHTRIGPAVRYVHIQHTHIHVYVHVQYNRVKELRALYMYMYRVRGLV
jgi:hypothetical protein